MAYRNGTYVAFHAGGVTDPTKSDIKYYNLLKSWDAHKNIDFTLINSHEKTNAVRDSSSKETLKKVLKTRLNNSKHLLLIFVETHVLSQAIVSTSGKLSSYKVFLMYCNISVQMFLYVC